MNQLRSRASLLQCGYIPSINRRCLSSAPTKNSAANKPNRKRSLDSIKKPVTLKDKLRARTTKPQKLIADEELIAERVSTRLEWARKSLTAFWRDSSPVTINEKRPPRYELKMDANWWFWNLLLAASPSIAIIAYCEFVAKPQMEKQAQEEGRFTPPPSTSLLDSLYLIVDWWTGRSVSQESSTTIPAKQEVPESPQIQKLQELKRRLEALESEIVAQQLSMDPVLSKEKVSPMKQRFMDRQGLKETEGQEEVNKLTTTQSPLEESGPRRVDQFWGAIVQVAKSTYEKSMEIFVKKEELDKDSSEKTEQATKYPPSDS